MSIVVLEAMAAGKPMVVTRVGENPHVVVDGETGLTVPPSNPEAIAAGFADCCMTATAGRIGDAARLRYEATFTTQHMITAYEHLYRGIRVTVLQAPAHRDE